MPTLCVPRPGLSRKWIAARLEMKSAANASQQLRRQQTSAKNLPPELQRWLILSENVA